VRVKILR